MNGHVPNKQSGFVMLAVVLAITVLAAIAFALNNQGASQVNAAAGEVQRDQLRYVAEAGMAHATWQLSQNTSCSGYGDVPITNFGVDSYRATFSTNKDSPVTVTATGSLASGIEHSLINSTVRAYQPAVALALQLGKTAGTDTMIDSFYPNANWGSYDDLTVRSNPSWVQRPLLEFDLSALPAGVRIISAKLELEQRIVGTPGVIGVHRVTRNWEEGTGKGTGNADGATWNEYDGASTWAVPGGDFDSTLYGTATITTAKNGGWVAWDIRDLVDAWVSGQFPNYGLILVGDGVVDNAEFQSREEPDPTAAPKLTIAYACECGKTCGVAPSGKNVLLIVGNDTTLASKDVGYKALMESWGHTVAVIDDGASQADYDTAMAAADVIYASGSAVGSSMLDKATYTTKGMVNEVNGKIDNFGFSSSTSATANFDTFSATNAAHYITEPFAGSFVTVFTSSLTNPVPGGTLAPDLQNVGEVSGTLALVTLETGATRYDSNPSQGRRAHLPFTSAETTDMTADGKTILQRALEWAAGATAVTVPIAHWKLDEGGGPTAFDSVGGNDATLNGDTTWVAGTLGDALDFDGSGDYVTTDSAFTPPPIGTVTFWMQVSGSPASHGRILGLGDTWEIRHVTTGTPDGIPYGLVFDLGVTGVNMEFVTTTTVDTPGHWYHIAAAYDTTTDAYAVYIDGVPHKSGTYSSPLAVPAASPLSLGTRTGSTNYFDGILDDVRVYDTMLSASEIADLAGGGGGLSGTFLDEFNAIAYNGSDGTLDWSNDWQETGESDGPGGGDFSVVNNSWCASGNCIQIREDRSSTRRLSREVDLTGAVSATLSLNYRRRHVSSPIGGTIMLEISNNGGSSFTPLRAYQMDTQDAAQQSDSLDISAYIAPDTQIRFSTSNVLYETAMYVDNVLIDTTGGGGGGGGGFAPVFESFEEYRDADNGSSAISVAKPAGTAVGDLLVAVVVTNRNNESTLVADDAGWNLLTVDREASSSTTGVWWKVAGGSEPASYGFSWNAANPGRSYSWIMRFSGNDPTSPINVWDKLGDGGSTTPPSPAVTTTVDDTLILRIGGFDDDDITVGDPGMAGHTPITMQESNSGTGTVSGGAAYVEQASSGNSGGANFTLTASEQSRTITIGIAPAP